MKFIDMFAGMGTVRMGFELAGHECVSAIEFDKHKRRIYEVIFGHEPEFSDITTVRGSDLPYADCWCFGAPCQDFSVAGLRAGLDGKRSGLVREVFRLIREKEPADRPEWLLYENVKGMLSSNSGWDFAAIQAEMGELGYDVQWELINSKDFGVPQNRERVYTIGHLRARGERKVFPIGTDNGNSTETGEQEQDLMYADCGIGHKWAERSSITPPLRSQGGGNAPEIAVLSKNGSVKESNTAGQYASCLTAGAHSGGNHSDMDLIVEPTVKQIGNVMPTATRDNPNQGRVYDPLGLAPCLNKMESGGREPLVMTLNTKDADGKEPPQQERVYSHDGIMTALSAQLGGRYNITTQGTKTRIRRLTPRECMRLQSVSDHITDKLIAAGISDTQMYRAAGDACTVNVIYEIARML